MKEADSPALPKEATESEIEVGPSVAKLEKASSGS